jgi:hypothetical protein
VEDTEGAGGGHWRSSVEDELERCSWRESKSEGGTVEGVLGLLAWRGVAQSEWALGLAVKRVGSDNAWMVTAWAGAAGAMGENERIRVGAADAMGKNERIRAGAADAMGKMKG